jgi:uncharacterized membrane protein YphA (DoxX/SURF4 family)
VVTCGELGCGMLLFVGLLTRLAALWAAVAMVGAIITVTGVRDFVDIEQTFRTGPYRFGTGYEYNFALIVISCALIVLGSGQWSVDYHIFHRRKGRQSVPPTVEIKQPLQPSATGSP